MSAGSVPSVELARITKYYGDVKAVDDISLVIEQGEFLTLLGPSGCGKTTTLRMIGGFEYPDAGWIAIGGELMGNRPPHRRPVNTVFQNYALFPHMSIAQNVVYGLEMAGVGKKDRQRRVAEALEMVRLPGIERRKPHELSGGQQQRVALARALINRPQVLLLDEPLGAVDLKLRKAMQLELKSLNREVGVTFVYVTHDQEEALTMSDRIAVMSHGHILQVGAPNDIYESPTSVFVADFIGQTNFLGGVHAGADGPWARVELPESGSILARPNGELVAGTEAVVAVRPERMSLIGTLSPEPADPGGNSLKGRVMEVIFLGTHTQYVVAVGGSEQMLALEQNRRGEAPAHRVGDEVLAHFRPQDASVLGG
jgi:spermidine/putrescine transport system ATP-binding protein